MGSREKILETIARYQPGGLPLPDLKKNLPDTGTGVTEFISVLEKIGGRAVEANGFTSVRDYVNQHYGGLKRIVSLAPELPWTVNQLAADPHTFEDVDLVILQGHFGVAENSAIWITDDRMGDRALPFITQHLALIIEKNSIVSTMHQAYEKINSQVYNFGTFIAGPSKTADIEQSLVLGAHGPKSLIVFLIDSSQP